MRIVDEMSATAMLDELGRRLRQQRLAQELTQADLASASGVPLRTVERLEAGSSVGLEKLVLVLRALGLSSNLDQLLPEASVVPMQLIGQRGGGQRQRASSRRRTGEPARGWVWGDEA